MLVSVIAKEEGRPALSDPTSQVPLQAKQHREWSWHILLMQHGALRWHICIAQFTGRGHGHWNSHGGMDWLLCVSPPCSGCYRRHDLLEETAPSGCQVCCGWIPEQSRCCFCLDSCKCFSDVAIIGISICAGTLAKWTSGYGFGLVW